MTIYGVFEGVKLVPLVQGYIYSNQCLKSFPLIPLIRKECVVNRIGLTEIGNVILQIQGDPFRSGIGIGMSQLPG